MHWHADLSAAAAAALGTPALATATFSAAARAAAAAVSASPSPYPSGWLLTAATCRSATASNAALAAALLAAVPAGNLLAATKYGRLRRPREDRDGVGLQGGGRAPGILLPRNGNPQPSIRLLEAGRATSPVLQPPHRRQRSPAYLAPVHWHADLSAAAAAALGTPALATATFSAAARAAAAAVSASPSPCPTGWLLTAANGAALGSSATTRRRQWYGLVIEAGQGNDQPVGGDKNEEKIQRALEESHDHDASGRKVR